MKTLLLGIILSLSLVAMPITPSVTTAHVMDSRNHEYSESVMYYKHKTDKYVQEVDAEEKLKELNRKFWTSKTSKEFVQQLLYRVWLFGDGSYDKFENIFIDYTGEMFGEDIAKALLEMTSIPKFKERIWDIYVYTEMLKEPLTCSYGVRELANSAAFITTYAVLFYYTEIPFGIGLIASYAGDRCEDFVEAKHIDAYMCEIFHKNTIVIFRGE